MLKIVAVNEAEKARKINLFPSPLPFPLQKRENHPKTKNKKKKTKTIRKKRTNEKQ